MEWITFTMDQLWELLAEDIPEKERKNYIKPTFPTRRWNNITTKNATTDKNSIENGIKKLKERGIECRKRICNEMQMKGFKFYKIEIKQN